MLPAEARLRVSASDLNYLGTYGIDPWWDPDREQAVRALAIVKDVRTKAPAALPPEALIS